MKHRNNIFREEAPKHTVALFTTEVEIVERKYRDYVRFDVFVHCLSLHLTSLDNTDGPVNLEPDFRI